MVHYTYILKSTKNNQYYIGSTSDIAARLKRHNSGSVKSTKNSIPWELFHKEPFHTLKDAVNRERQLKSWKSRAAIERLKINKIARPRLSLGRGRGGSSIQNQIFRFELNRDQGR